MDGHSGDARGFKLMIRNLIKPISAFGLVIISEFKYLTNLLLCTVKYQNKNTILNI